MGSLKTVFGCAVRNAFWKGIKATAIAPIMTKARLASQSPNRSRKSSTFSGLDMPDTNNPTENSAPNKKANTFFNLECSSDKTANINSDKTCKHKSHGRDDRTLRQATDATNSVTTGTARTQKCPKADQQTCHNHHQWASIQFDFRLYKQTINKRCEDQT